MKKFALSLLVRVGRAFKKVHARKRYLDIIEEAREGEIIFS